MVKLLMDKGADPFIKGPKNSTVLHICAERNFEEIAKAIVDHDREKFAQLVYE